MLKPNLTARGSAQRQPCDFQATTTASHSDARGNALFEKFSRLLGTVIAVPKAAIDKEEAKWKRRKKRAKKAR